MAIYSGSWFGLPDFGITEKIGSVLGKEPTYQGGSNLLGSYPQASVTPAPNYQTPYNYNANLQPQSPTGQVAGATTPQSSGGGSQPSGGGIDIKNPSVNPGNGWWWDAADGWKFAGGDAQAEADRRADQVRNTINSGYDALSSNLQGLIPFYEGQQNTQLQSAQDIYNQIAQGLGQTKDTAMDKLGIARNQVQANVGNSVKDLQQNLMGVVRNTSMQLGAMGAGDTSASNVMAPYAYTKLAGQEYGKIQRQGNDQIFQIQTQERDTENQYNQMVNQANIEKEQELQGIRDQFGGIIAQIRNQMANVPAERAQALSNLETNLLQQAQSRLSQIEGYYMNLQGEMQNWAQNRMAQLNDAKMQLSQSANFNPQDIVWQELQARNMVNQTPSTGAYWNPEMMKKRREELGY